MRESIAKKQQQVEELTQKFSEAKTIVTFDYPGLTVKQFTELRDKLRENGCECTVYKNNISRRASVEAGYDELVDELVGPKAIIMSFEDVVAPAKIINDFAKANKVIEIHGGVIEGEVVGKEAILELAKLPDYDTMLTMLAAGLLAPVRDLAIGLNMMVEEGQPEAQPEQ